MGNDVKRYDAQIKGEPHYWPMVHESDYAALEAERNELQRRLDAADGWATLASEQLKERDALAAELQALKAQAGQEPRWRDMATAPRDGTMVRLLVEFTEHATEDADQAPTIGANNFENDGEDRWQFAGWCWSHDRFIEGVGEPVGWLPMLDAPAIAAPPAAQDVSALPPFAEKVLAKLRRFEECAEDPGSGGVDIGRNWLDLLTQLALLNRVQRSPGLWEISQQGEDFLATHRPAQQQDS